ncbi:MAG: TauD/TfdA dioxygenase family protein [Stellaceae bacterium]
MAIYTLMPLHECLGLAVIGVDLRAPIDAETAEGFSRLLAEHLVLVFPEQVLTATQYLAAAASFGAPMREHASPRPLPDFPHIGLAWTDIGESPGRGWHSDHVDRAQPPAATLLFGVETPSAGGGISIADMRAAYWSLPDDERLRLEGMHWVHRAAPSSNAEEAGAADDETPAAHPAVRTHPVSRERAIYLRAGAAISIAGMTQAASQAYLADLDHRMIQPEFVYNHSWRKGDVVVIDDRATLRRVDADYPAGENRILWRIYVEGERPVFR